MTTFFAISSILVTVNGSSAMGANFLTILLLILPFHSQEHVVTGLGVFVAPAQSFVGLFLVRFVSLSKSFLRLWKHFGEPFFHSCLKSSTPLYSVDGSEAAIGPGALKRTNSNRAMDVNI